MADMGSKQYDLKLTYKLYICVRAEH